MTADKKQRRITIALFLACTIFLFVLMMCVPLSSDDFEWSTQSYDSAAQLLERCLGYGNGRLLGNLNMMLLARNTVVSAAVKALMISGLIFMLPSLLDMKGTWAYLLSFLLFVCLRPTMFGQVYTWTSGFGNYIPPVWLGLVIFMLLRRCGKLSSAGGRAFICALIFVLGLAAQLYVEHVSLLMLIVSAGLLLHCRREGKKPAPLVCWLMGAAIGLVIMIYIPQLFAQPGNRAEGYRGVINGSIRVLLEGVVRGVGSATSSFPPVGSLIISALALVSLRYGRDKRSEKVTRFIFCLSVFCFFCVLVNEFVLGNRWLGRMIVLRNLFTGAVGILPLILWGWALFWLENKRLRNRIYMLLALSLISLAPFAIVQPVPERVAFLSYVFAAAAILLFADYLAEEFPQTKKRLGTALGCAAAAAVLLLGMSFVNVLWLSGIRDEHIVREMEKGAQEITIFQIPHGYVYWDGTYLFGRGYYYEQWHDITFRETTFEDWFVNHWMK